MKLRHTNQIELSEANIEALYRAYHDRKAGIESAYPLIYKVTEEGVTIAVSVVSNEEHYNALDLARRKASDDWAGAL